MYLDINGIDAVIKEFDEDTKALKKELFKLTWYLRGGITYDNVLCLSFDERELIKTIIDENLEITKESGLPFF